MSLKNLLARPCPMTLRVLAHLLRYPNAELRAHADEMHQALLQEKALPQARIEELRQLINRIANAPDLEMESLYVETFDRGRQTSLYLFEHVHGDSRERGPAMLDLIDTYRQAGLLMREDDLPDHLPVVLEFASTQPTAQARAFLGEVSHLAQTIFSALIARQSPWACVVGAVVELAGEQAKAAPLPAEEDLDESWEEPAAFDGCSTAGQNAPGTEQPVHIVRTASRKSTNSSGVQA